ncbi:MAG: SDR family oxidoreductase [Aliihoeflea sp.]|uniref:SDR family oxidoreductase n=1 Tax=Aliihoeflea sp. TaxID=2608088 RepID=UPI004034448B
MTIAVTGATGQLGRIVIDKSKAQTKEQIIALVRSPEKAADLGVEVRRADYEDEASLDAALKGVDTLLLISSSEVGKRAAQHYNVIEAAKKNGVKRIVYTSLLRADTSPLSLAAEHAETEKQLKASGIPYTILRNGWYTENYTGSLEGAVAAGALIGSAGEGRIASAARADYADAAVAVLTTPGHDGKTYELAGDDSFSLAELAAEVSKQTGKPIAYTDTPQADYARTLEGFGLPAGLSAAIAGWDAAAGKGALFDDGRTLSKLIGRPTTPFAQTVKAALA